MPSGAVVGGQKSNGEPLFVAAMWTTDDNLDTKYMYGHYDPESETGYAYDNPRVATNTSVDIIVEIWASSL